MVQSVISLQVPPKRKIQGKQMQRRLNIEQLKEEGIKTNFQLLFNENLPAEYPNDIEQHWSILKTARAWIILFSGGDSNIFGQEYTLSVKIPFF